MKNIIEIAKKIGIENNIELYGNDKAKINLPIKENKNNKLILVTSTNPTPEGEGKTTLSIGLNDALNYLGKKSIVALREPSMGPVFGAKGGACGGGEALIVPEEDINLHFTGDFHAITSANNLLSAIIDDHIYQGNDLDIQEVVFKRCLDVNDRELRNVELKHRHDSFVITPASEIMAIICLAKDIDDLRNKLSNILIGYNSKHEPIYAKELECVDSLLLLLKDAIKPNLVQTLYENPAIVHGGPFANIAHGCNSVIATKTAMSLSDYTITEAGFGSDMGALKFLDIKCRLNDIYPDAIVINSTIKSLKYNGDGDLNIGKVNLEFHINLMKQYNDNVIVSLNKFEEDTDEEINIIKELCDNNNVPLFISTMYKDGETGCLDLAKYIIDLKPNKNHFEAYNVSNSLIDKIDALTKLLGAKNVKYADNVLNKIKDIDANYPGLPICIAKTPMSITDDKDIHGYPKDFTFTITGVSIQAGAGFIVIYMGNILTMPGLSKNSNFKRIKFTK